MDVKDKETSDLIGQRKIRLEKVKKLRDLGIDPYPAKANRTHTNIEIVNNFEKLENQEVTVAGRLITLREHGKLVFADLRDMSGSIQLYIKADELKPTDAALGTLGFEDLNLADT